VEDGEGRTTSYEWDVLSRATKIIQPLGQEIVLAWDSRDRLDFFLSARNQKVDYDYETWGPLKEEKQYPTASATTPDRTDEHAAGGPNTFAYVSANPTSSVDPLGLDGSCCNNDYINCLADCIRYLDPFTVMQKVLLTGAGGTFPKSWVGLPRGMGGASPLTTVPSATAHGLGGGGAGTAGGVARGLGRFFSPIWITYGVTMFAVEVYCATVCAKDKCAY
jgi:hypothetical protein